MMHVWFTRDLRSAFAIGAPEPELCRDGLLSGAFCRSPGARRGDVRPPRLPWPRAGAGLRRRPFARRPVGRRRRSDRRGGNRAVPDRLRGRHPGAVRDAARARRLGHVPPHRRAASSSSSAPFPLVRDGGGGVGPRPAARLGGLSVAVWSTASRPRRRTVLEGTRAVLVEFPGWWLDVDGAVELVAAAARARRAGRPRAAARPSRAMPRGGGGSRVGPSARRGRLAALPQRAVADRRPRGERRAGGLAAPRGRASCRSSRRTRTALEAPPRVDRAYAAVEASIGRDAALPLFDGTARPLDALIRRSWSSPGAAGFGLRLLGAARRARACGAGRPHPPRPSPRACRCRGYCATSGRPSRRRAARATPRRITISQMPRPNGTTRMLRERRRRE